MRFPGTESIDKQFAHGDYADYWGMIFHARSADGKWIDALHISDIYIDPICCGIMKRYLRENDGTGEMASTLTINSYCGIDLDENIPSTTENIKLFLEELSLLTITDLYLEAYGDTDEQKLSCVEDFKRCINVITEYLNNRLTRGLQIWVEDD
ncbi:hypothetical protein [Chamaesiphon minutus]|uniref:Uncharacterized protein n=1 Tax=Chamaesiphon minutus (strain ATCC 27169 / PCC 6605) TaxID=1173020 RepID=K9UFK3_CHAP6|nr:hypothetical protein [Chamaesiphon minutus]AFY93882.1 hypothetical protein Cha6605_2846 [Chamaesiphon minutus PCC 6605]